MKRSTIRRGKAYRKNATTMKNENKSRKPLRTGVKAGVGKDIGFITFGAM